MRARPSLCVLAVLAWPSVARADPARDAAADALFQEAKQLMDAGQFAPACRKLEESMALAPAGGTQLWLASCYEGEGKTATAWVVYGEALSRARQDGRGDREAAARARMQSLAPRLSRIVVRVSKEADAVPGLEVKRDGIVVGGPLLGVAVPVDPGEHVLVAGAPGVRSWRSVVTVKDPGSTIEVIVPALARDPEATDAAAGPPAYATDDAARPSGMGLQRGAALVAGGAGVVVLGVGAVAGIVSMSKHAQSDAHCPGPNHTQCDADGVGFANDAIDAGNLSTATFVAGGALVLAGVVLWLTEPRGTTTPAAVLAPSFAAGTAGLALTGVFR